MGPLQQNKSLLKPLTRVCKGVQFSEKKTRMITGSEGMKGLEKVLHVKNLTCRLGYSGVSSQDSGLLQVTSLSKLTTRVCKSLWVSSIILQWLISKLKH